MHTGCRLICICGVLGFEREMRLTHFADLTIESFDLFVEVGEWLEGVLDLLEVVELAGTAGEFEGVTVIVVAIFGETCA